MRGLTVVAILLASAEPALAQVFSSEFFSDPLSEDWDLVQQYCDPEVWVENGTYRQLLDFAACGEPPPPGGGQDSWVRDIAEYNGVANWFFEFRVITNGDRSEIPGNAPTALTAGNFFGESYTATVASDRVKFFREDAGLPVVFVDVVPEAFHTIRLELDNVGTPFFRWFVDGVIVDEGVTEDVFPSADARITWRGKAWYLPCENAWQYIRYGVRPMDGSLDYDTSGTVDEFDFYFFQECFLDPAIQAWPGCRFADANGDQLVSCTDWDALLDAWDGALPPSVELCPPGWAIPTVSQWSAACLTILLVTGGTLVFRTRSASDGPACQ